MDRWIEQARALLETTPLLGHPMTLLAAGLLAGVVLSSLLRSGPLSRKLDRLRDAHAAQGVELARAEERAAQAALLSERLDVATDALSEERALSASLEERLKTETASHAARMTELRNAQEEMRRSFDALANEALGKNANAFLTLVSERFEKHKQSAEEDLGKRQHRIETMLKPISESLARFETQVGELEKNREGAYQAIRTQVETLTRGQVQLNAETRRLVQALRAPKTRGNWGEFQLRQVFDMAGMVDHVDFRVEQPLDEGRLRPDAVVQLPGGKSIVVDAKTPLDAFLNALESDDAETKRTELTRHARQVKDQVKLLSQKAYWDSLDASPEFVVMFVPGEAFYSAALEQDPALFEYAINNRVMIASPTTMIALLKSVAYGWQQERMAANAVKAVELGRDLYKRVSAFGGHLERMGKSLNSTLNAYNSAIGSVERSILPAARKFEDLSIAPHGDAIAEIAPLDAEVRQISAPELDDTENGDPAARARS